MRKMPLVTILTSAYNAENTLKRAIESVLAQSYENFEYMIIDHAAEDLTSDIIDQYIEIDHRIRKISMSYNTGFIGKALNFGLDCAKGEYVCFLDADDAYHPDFLEIMVNCATIVDYDVVACGFNMISFNKTHQFASSKLFDYERALYNKDDYEKYWCTLLNDFSQSLYIDAWWNKLYKIEFLKSCDCKFPEDIKTFADAVFNHDVFMNMPKAYFVKYEGLDFYVNEGTTSKKYFKGKYLEILRYIEVRKSLFEMVQTENQRESICRTEYIEKLIRLAFHLFNIQDSLLEPEESLEDIYAFISGSTIKDCITYDGLKDLNELYRILHYKVLVTGFSKKSKSRNNRFTRDHYMARYCNVNKGFCENSNFVNNTIAIILDKENRFSLGIDLLEQIV